MAEQIVLHEFVAGTAVLVATGSETLQVSEQATGTVDTLAFGKESVLFREYATAIFEGRGASQESLTFSEYSIGAASIGSGTLQESLRFTEHANTELWGRNQEQVVFGEIATGVSNILATSRESVSFSEKIRGELVETPDGVWVVNLFHGGHSRYVGDLTGVQPVDAYALLPASQLGSDQAKFVPDVYAHLRTSGSMSITAVVDEQREVVGENIVDDGRAGMHRRRAKMPLGIRGVNWQLKLANIEGADFTAKTIEVTPVVSRRVS